MLAYLTFVREQRKRCGSAVGGWRRRRFRISPTASKLPKADWTRISAMVRELLLTSASHRGGGKGEPSHESSNFIRRRTSRRRLPRSRRGTRVRGDAKRGLPQFDSAPQPSVG